MRYSTEHKQLTRSRVLKEAASVIRAKGPNGVAVADIMARAGLTHGGFYAHFESKNELVREAIATMFGDVSETMANSGRTDDAVTTLRDFLVYYLSAEHRDNAASGCPMPALSADLARAEGPARTCFTQGVENFGARLADALKAIGIADADDEALALQAQLVGAVALARAVDSPVLSDKILHDNYVQIANRFGLTA